MVRRNQSTHSTAALTDDGQTAPTKKKSTARRHRAGAKSKGARKGRARTGGHKKAKRTGAKRAGRKGGRRQKHASHQEADATANSDE